MTKNESLEPKKEQKLFMAKLPSDIESMTPEQIKEISIQIYDQIQRTRYFQTVSLDGKETPLDFYRSGEGFEDTWDEVAEEWVPTTSLTHMMIRGDVALDEIDYDPTTRLGDH